MLRILERQTARCHAPRRAGILVVKELMLLLICLVSLFSLGAKSLDWLVVDDVHVAAHARLSRVASLNYVSRLATDREGTTLWICRPLRMVSQVNLESGETEQGIVTEGRKLSRIAHSQNNSTTLLVWAEGEAELYRHGLLSSPISLLVRSRGESFVIDAGVSADGTIAVFVSQNGEVQGWLDRESATEVFCYSLPTSSAVSRACLDPQGRRLFVAREDKTAGIHEVLTGVDQKSPLKLPAVCTSAVWSADGSSILVATQDGSISLLDAVSGQTQWQGKLNTTDLPKFAWADSIAISRDGTQVAAASSHSKLINVWNRNSAAAPHSLAGHEGVIRSLEFGHDSQTLYSGSLDGTVREWSLASYTQRRIID